MELRALFVSALFIFLLGCKKKEHVDPEENARSYIGYSIDGKRYRLEHSSGSQYIGYFNGGENSTLFPYKFVVAGGDSTGNAASFRVTIWSRDAVTKGVWEVSTDFYRTSDVVMT